MSSSGSKVVKRVLQPSAGRSSALRRYPFWINSSIVRVFSVLDSENLELGYLFSFGLSFVSVSDSSSPFF
jgi:hypothetical protein